MNLARDLSKITISAVSILRWLREQIRDKNEDRISQQSIAMLRTTTRTRKRKKLQPNPFHISDIKYDSTCITLDLPLDFCCEVCKRKKDIFTKKSSKPEKKQKYLHSTNQCKQLWDSSWAEKTHVTNGTLVQHNRVRNYLGIEAGVRLDFKCAYNKNQKFTILKQQAKNDIKKVHSEKSAPELTVCESSTSEPVAHQVAITPPESEMRAEEEDIPEPTNPPSGSERTPTPLISPRMFLGDLQTQHLPPPLLSALNSLTPSDLQSIMASPTMTACVRDLVLLASSQPSKNKQNTPHNNHQVPKNKNSNTERLTDTCNPKLYEHVSKSKLAKLEKKADIYNSVRDKIKKKQTHMSDLSRRLYGVMMMMAPKLSLEIAESICALSVAAYINDCGFNIDEIANSTPSASKLKEIMVEEAMETVLLEREEMSRNKLTILCDKGEGLSSRDGAAFVKLAARYDDERQRVRATSIGIQSAGNTSEDGALGIDEALKIFDRLDGLLEVNSTGTDAGGGATREHLGKKLELRGRIKKLCEYIATTCTLHAMNLTLQSPTELTMGEGGLQKRTAMQLLHTAYNLTQKFRTEEWAKLWRQVATKKWEEIKCPVMTRWEYVSQAADHLLKNKKEWLIMAKAIVSFEATNTAKHTIASYLCSLIQEPMLLSHVEFLHAYVSVWWDRHFQWLKHVDAETQTPGFLAVHMPLRYFLLTKELNDLAENWKEKKEFENFVREFPQESDYTKEELAKLFFGRVKNRLHKHFSQWKDKCLFLMLGGEPQPATYLAHWLVGRGLPPPASFESKKHHCTVDLHAMMAFLTKDKTPEEYHSKEFFHLHKPAIEEIALGKEIRDNDASECVKQFYTYVKHSFFTVCTNTQLVERWVKDANECFASGKDEHFASLVGICRSATVFEYKHDAKIEAKERVLKGNRFLTKGKMGERIDKQTGLVEKQDNDKVKVNVRGASFTNLVVRNTKERSRKLDCLKVSREESTRVRNLLSSKIKQLSTIRTSTTLEKYSTHLSNPSHQHRPENAMQRVTGYDTTPDMQGHVQYTKLGTRHISFVREEILARGGIFEAKDKIRKLGKILLTLETVIQKREIREKTGNECPNDEMLNTKTYRPKCRPASEYEIN